MRRITFGIAVGPAALTLLAFVAGSPLSRGNPLLPGSHHSSIAAEPIPPCTDGKYENWSKEQIAQDLIQTASRRGFITGTPTVVRLADIYQADADALGLSRNTIAFGCEPDVAIVLQGTFHWPIMGAGMVTRPYMLWLVDRELGAVDNTSLSDNVSYLLAMLPPE